MNSRSHSTHRSAKGKEPARSSIIYFDDPPAQNVPSTNASRDTNASKATCTGTNMTPLGTVSESSKTGGQNRFSPSSLSIGPRPNRGQPHPSLPIFSSNDFPQAETRSGPNNNVNNGNTTPQTPQDIRRRSFTTKEKCQAIEMCLTLRDEYLNMPLALNHDQGPFWTKVLNEKLDRNLAAKVKTGKALKECVEYWCLVRRTLLREGRLPAISQSQPELDTLVDSWNQVFAERFCRMYKGYFESASTSQLPVPRAVPLPMASSDQTSLPESNENVAAFAFKSTSGSTDSCETIFTNPRTTEQARRQLPQGSQLTVSRHMGG
ncbi:uncharacterized protein FSUBG_2214 [Fusarium subglutinans]|uniref:Uncharacterized protein n=1 Tax=Gibberella subglutinans TaxID=42677 RepID=A0A8H5QB42_GIBSU|nr:uncharacterized protein FSUBG_2214 [Fusarium subglutinans]KAF5611383.1 hypothetical protein FSUBG_2214 [Fusarium subglutinans]